jgi:hypothetical protein
VSTSCWRNSRIFRGLRIAILTGLFAATTQCTREAASASCRNDAQCRASDDEMRYCVNRRCAECVTHAACGSESRCVRGRCE